MKRARTSRRQAAALVAAGTLAGLTLLELGLRAAGAFLARGSPFEGRRASSVVVLCVGESTTAPTLPKDHSWPAQLAVILNAAGSRRFTVVNEGLTGAHSDELLALLPPLLETHRPSVVVGMLGINDAQWYGLPDPADQPTPLARPLRSLRLYKVARYVLHELARRDTPKGGAAGVETQRALARVVLERGVPLILMQYPGLDVADLKARFDGFTGVDFVDNKTAFDRALASGRYESYFIDRFAGEWGHCTAAGDRLIAENAAGAVLAAADRLGLEGKKADEPTPFYVARGRAWTNFFEATPDEFSREEERQLAEFRKAPTLDTLGKLVALLRAHPEKGLLPADRALARKLLADVESGRSTRSALRRAFELYLELGEKKQALGLLDRLADAEPTRAEPRLEQAELAARMNRGQAALEALARARALARDKASRRRLAIDLQDLGQRREAAAILDSLAREDPSDARLQLDLGVCRSQMGDPEKATAALSRAIALEPGLFQAYASLASIYAAQGRYDRARAVYDDALSRGVREGSLRRALEKGRAELASKK